MPDLHQTEIDGVRCFWVATERPTLAAMLLFRQGIADETIAEAGWQHLLEHMALKDRQRGGLEVNGSVSLLETTFQAHGPPDSVVDFLDQLTTWLAAPLFDHLTIETKVLQSELALRGVTPPMAAMAMRYGTRGPGTAGYGEPGLGRATPEALAARAARVFTQGNAVLILDGPPPEALRLHLPPGQLLPVSDAVPCDDELPAAYASDVGLMVSGVVPRSATLAVGHDLLRQRLSESLREQHGAAYAPWSTYERVDAEHAIVMGGSDVHPDALSSVADTTLTLVGALARVFPGGQELRDLKAARVQALLDPYAKVGIAARAAHEFQRRQPPLSLDDMVAEVEAVTSAQLREGWEHFSATALLGVPGDATWNDLLPVLSFRETVPARAGKRYRSVNWPADRTRLTIDRAGVEVSSRGRARDVPLDQVAALFTYEDGRRHVLRHDGYGLSIDPRAWRAGDAAVARLDATVPPELHLPQRATDEPPVVRLGALRRWAGAAVELVGPLKRGFDLYLVAVMLAIVAAVALAVLSVAAGRVPSLLVIGVATYWGIRLLLGARDSHRT